LKKLARRLTPPATKRCQRATKERDHFVESISRGSVGPSKRLKTVLEARRERKVKAAAEECEAAYRKAQEELMEELDG
jgi:hypothetical protein